jgi:hypothetical protein
MENNLHQDIAQFITQAVRAGAFNGVDGLICFFKQILAQAFVGLGAIPGAAPFAAQESHEIEQFINGKRIFLPECFGCINRSGRIGHGFSPCLMSARH